MSNIYKEILTETAYCASHLKSTVSRNFFNNKNGEWAKHCQRGNRLRKYDMTKIEEFLLPGEKLECEIVIEGGGENK